MLGKCQDYVNSQRIVMEKLLSGKIVPKLFITSWIFAFPSKTVHSNICT